MDEIEIEIGKPYKITDRTLLRKLFDTTDTMMLAVWFINGRQVNIGYAYGFGSKVGLHTEGGVHVGDVEVDQIVAAMITRRRLDGEWWKLPTPCAKCGAELFTDGVDITDTDNSTYCVDPSAPGRGAGQKHTILPAAKRLRTPVSE